VKLHFTYGLWIRNAWLWHNPAVVSRVGPITRTMLQER
jgi:hypothetical protein